jgi:hypothetical protein
MGEMKNVGKILTGNHERKRPLGRSKRRWEKSITMHLKE